LKSPLVYAFYGEGVLGFFFGRTRCFSWFITVARDLEGAGITARMRSKQVRTRVTDGVEEWVLEGQDVAKGVPIVNGKQDGIGALWKGRASIAGGNVGSSSLGAMNIEKLGMPLLRLYIIAQFGLKL
jgi:hypothetical protein